MLKCTSCKAPIKVGDYAAAGAMMKPFCRKCETYIYKSHEFLIDNNKEEGIS
ncbi:hypothetical protein [Virgibacillus sp. YIM 98842]|uniref:hypothetical protein n=1 Tax=Virgibacillus sp. YIM 98842 TaxID=2663533 RepID=UPI0013DB9A0C|nr:hypothetical protein [Virgibacillus sp. YIM 98842]